MNSLRLIKCQVTDINIKSSYLLKIRHLVLGHQYLTKLELFNALFGNDTDLIMSYKF